MILRPLQQLLQGENPDQLVAVDKATRYTRGDLLGAVAGLSVQLQQHPAQRWLLVHENAYRFAIGLLALLAAGKAVVLPPNAQAGTLADLSPHADALLGEGDTCLPVLPIALAAGGDIPPLPLLDTDTLTITVFTSGSTGEPKQIDKPLRCFEAEILALEALWGERLADAVVLSTVSHQHIYGLLFRLLWPLCAGRPFAALPQPYPESLLAEAGQHPRSVLVSSPSQLKRFSPSAAGGAVIPSVVAVFSSGGPLPLAAAQAWQTALGHAPLEVLGSTETGGVAWRCQTAADTPWQPLPGVRLQCDDDDALSVISPFTGSRDPIALGDRATLLPEGHFQLLGRADRIIKVEEKRLSLTGMEQHLLDSGLVAEAQVLSLPGGRLGAVATLTHTGATILAQQGKRALAARLRDHLDQHFERVLLPRKWRFPDQMPANTLGKVTRANLLALFTEPRPAVTTTVLRDSGQELHLQLHFPPGAEVFDGHFPGLPILPGVAQFDMAVRHCACWYPLEGFRRIEKLKFQEPIVPGDTVSLYLQRLEQGQVGFVYQLADQVLSSGRIVFATGSS